MILLVALGMGSDSRAVENWPMWRFDSMRSASSPNSLPDQVQLLWQRTFTPRVQAWDDPLNQDLMTYDKWFEPIVLDSKVFLPFSDQDKLMALDARSGETLWQFFANGPIRMAPVGWRDRVLVTSDDGNLYCLDADTGTLRWKFQGGPNSQQVLGNTRLISAWPARGGAVVRDDTVYFAASIWPFMGTFIYALDIESGAVQWVNDNTGAQYIKQPHSAPAFAGVAPQGMLVATESRLLVPGGRSVPAVFDRRTGALDYFEINAGGKGTGGAFVAADRIHFYVHTREKGTRAFHIETGLKTAFVPNEPVITEKYIVSAERIDGVPRLLAYPANLNDDKSREPLWSIDVDGTRDLIGIKDGFIAVGKEHISVIKLTAANQDSTPTATVTTRIPVPEPIGRVVVANQSLYAVSDTGGVYAYGKTPMISTSIRVRENVVDEIVQQNEPPKVAGNEWIAQLLAAGDAQGYGFWFGDCGDEIVDKWTDCSPFSQLAIVVPDVRRVDAIRDRLDRRGVYGKITAHGSAISEFRPPQYVANMVFVSSEIASNLSRDQVRAMYSAVRPYGGTMILIREANQGDLLSELKAYALEGAQMEIAPFGVIVRREGPLEGTADWTHQYGDVANTIKSNDRLVKLPLGVLWFGASSNMDVLPRHGHGPPEQVVGGRLFIEGMSSLSARDVYTGRVLWKREFGDLGTFDVYYDTTYENTPLDPKYNQVHIPGANGRGTNYIVTEDRIYLIRKNACLILDPATGQDLGEIRLPKDSNGNDPEWGYIGVYKDVLLGGLGFASYRERHKIEIESDKELKLSKAGFGTKSLDRAASQALVAFDRYSGRQLWNVDAANSFWHNGIVAGGGRVYCLDRNPTVIEETMKRRGKKSTSGYKITALDYKSGEKLWEITDRIFGTWLGYSETYNSLLQAGSQASDRLTDEIGTGMRVYDATDGTLRWERDALKYAGPCVLHNEWIITNTNSYSESAGAFHIQTGEQRMEKNPITGEMQPWKITRAYGCNSIIASENLLTFRSGAAGYYDLVSDSGTGNLGGFRSGCTSNLVVANGVLNAPDYTRTCSCSYQNQTSLALIHMPDIDVWTVHPTAKSTKPFSAIESLAVNFGAPGDRRDRDGTLWIEYPSLAADAHPIEISMNADAKPFQHHSSRLNGIDRSWLYSSGIENVRELRIKLMTIAPPETSDESVKKDDDDDGAKKDKPKSADATKVSEKSGDSSSGNEKSSATISEQTMPSRYDVELFFMLPAHGMGADSVEFDFVYPGKRETVLLNDRERIVRRRFTTEPIASHLEILFESKKGIPVLNGIRVERLD
jgi:outer membrane protein assembly factor BamB